MPPHQTRRSQRKGEKMNQAVRKLIALLAALALVCSLAACSSQQSEEENTTEPPIVSKTKKPEANAEVLAYFNRLVNSAKQSNPEFTMTKEPKVSEVETSNQTLANLAPTLQQLMLNQTSLSSKDTKLSEVLPVSGQEWASQLTLPTSVTRCVCRKMTFIKLQYSFEMKKSLRL